MLLMNLQCTLTAGKRALYFFFFDGILYMCITKTTILFLWWWKCVDKLLQWQLDQTSINKTQFKLFFRQQHKLLLFQNSQNKKLSFQYLLSNMHSVIFLSRFESNEKRQRWKVENYWTLLHFLFLSVLVVWLIHDSDLSRIQKHCKRRIPYKCTQITRIIICVESKKNKNLCIKSTAHLYTTLCLRDLGIFDAWVLTVKRIQLSQMLM